ncbi:MAG: DNA repair protein RadA, partial [Ruminococcaceae bacterium]|nr:DNA repair protein RadA [Oscillospiraceae bacterium]
MKAPKTYYICSECGYKSAKWLGRCPTCGEWNTMEEEIEAPAEMPKRLGALGNSENEAVTFSELEMPHYMRDTTGLSELDRVL